MIRCQRNKNEVEQELRNFIAEHPNLSDKFPPELKKDVEDLFFRGEKTTHPTIRAKFGCKKAIQHKRNNARAKKEKKEDGKERHRRVKALNDGFYKENKDKFRVILECLRYVSSNGGYWFFGEPNPSYK